MNLHYQKNILSSWWWTIDRLIILALVIVLSLSAIMVATASPAVADRIGIESFYFIRKQLSFLVISACTMVFFSFLNPVIIRRIAVFGYIACIILLVLVLFKAPEVKGAKRWLNVIGFSLQPSEFIKPFFSILTGWILAQKFVKAKFPVLSYLFLSYGILITLLVLQPDFGMIVTITAVWGGQLFLAGLSLWWIFTAFILSGCGLGTAYLFLPHVTKRINSFLDPDNAENYQIKKSLEAFSQGGFYGLGPGEGKVKQSLPDSHTDFIFAVIGEELGVVACLIVISLFAFIVLRGFYKLAKETDLYIFFASCGILMQFGLQAIINMGVALHLLPTKGMTLPFISYGGSSMLATSIAIGMLLSLTKRRYGNVNFAYREIFTHKKNDFWKKKK